MSNWYCTKCGLHVGDKPGVEVNGVRLACPDCGSMSAEMRVPMPIWGPDVTLLYGDDGVPETSEQKIQRLIKEAALRGEHA